MAVQAVSLPLQDILRREIDSSVQFKAVPDIFAQQSGIYPESGEKQLPSFGANYPWADILDMLNEQRILLIMIRHGEAWENINPYTNDVCEFEIDGQTIQNFDSRLDLTGIKQAIDLNNLLLSKETNNSSSTWFDVMGLTNKPFFVSPLSRTLETANIALKDLPIPEITVSEMIRASIGTDVCNYRRSVQSLTSTTELPAPWYTGCKLPEESLMDIYGPSSDTTNVNFKFTIRPAGGEGIGLISDGEQLWRNDVVDDTHIIRAKTFMSQLFDYRKSMDKSSNSLPIVGIVTHGEMIKAFYEAAGELSYGALNTEVVPLIIEKL
jgi:hypothetical protein